MEKPKWDPTRILREISPMASPSAENRTIKRCVPDHPIKYIDVKVLGTWSIENISKAAKLLRKPPLSVTFNDEHEMRRVYSLIYDVFRYKYVLSQTLSDVSFFAHYPKLKNDENRVWLMLFELYVRHFLKRHAEEVEEQDYLYKEAEVDYISERLWTHRVRLAAAIARLRIKNGALLLSQLLPVHLQDEKVAIAAANPIVNGWMNPFKLKNKKLAEEVLKNMGMTEVCEDESENDKSLKPNQYKWDKVCPLFISCLPNDRSHFAQSDLVRNNYFIMQDRTFSIAPAVLSRLLDHFELDGDVVQTHVSSPRTTAYLAALFYSVNRVNDFLAFGAGKNLSEYKDYIKTLGVNNIRLFGESFCSLPLDSPILGTVVGIFATPPNSFSGIADPIDLICSRGGDLSMLAVLTESEISEEGKDRVVQLLKEQRDTLKLAMSRPQIQFVLYETHSIVGSENQDMVEKAVEYINRSAFEKHLQKYKEKRRLEELAELEAANIPSVALIQNKSKRLGASATTIPDKKLEEPNTKQCSLTKECMDNSEEPNNLTENDYSKHIEVPKTDEFLVSKVPDICINQDKCLNLGSLGCFVSLIHRKEVTKLDAKYLIKMAEARGLFGNAEKKKSAKVRTVKRPEENIDYKKDIQKKSTKLKKGDIPLLIERLNQPTHSSFIRSNIKSLSSVEGKPVTFDLSRKICLRHGKHHGEYCTSPLNNHNLNGSKKPPSRAKLWWKNTFKYVSNLQKLNKTEEKESTPVNGLISGKIKESNSGEMPPFRLPKTFSEYCGNVQKNCKNGYIQSDHRHILSSAPKPLDENYINSHYDQPSYFDFLLEKKPFPVTINRIEFKYDKKSQSNKSHKFSEYSIYNNSICRICKHSRRYN